MSENIVQDSLCHYLDNFPHNKRITKPLSIPHGPHVICGDTAGVTTAQIISFHQTPDV